MRNAYTILVGEPKGRDHLGRLGVEQRKEYENVKWILLEKSNGEFFWI
jgi:hypothetical protein